MDASKRGNHKVRLNRAQLEIVFEAEKAVTH